MLQLSLEWQMPTLEELALEKLVFELEDLLSNRYHYRHGDTIIATEIESCLRQAFRGIGALESDKKLRDAIASVLKDHMQFIQSRFALKTMLSAMRRVFFELDIALCTDYVVLSDDEHEVETNGHALNVAAVGVLAANEDIEMQEAGSDEPSRIRPPYLRPQVSRRNNISNNMWEGSAINSSPERDNLADGDYAPSVAPSQLPDQLQEPHSHRTSALLREIADLQPSISPTPSNNPLPLSNAPQTSIESSPSPASAATRSRSLTAKSSPLRLAHLKWTPSSTGTASPRQFERPHERRSTSTIRDTYRIRRSRPHNASITSRNPDRISPLFLGNRRSDRANRARQRSWMDRFESLSFRTPSGHSIPSHLSIPARHPGRLCRAPSESNEVKYEAFAVSNEIRPDAGLSPGSSVLRQSPEASKDAGRQQPRNDSSCGSQGPSRAVELSSHGVSNAVQQSSGTSLASNPSIPTYRTMTAVVIPSYRWSPSPERANNISSSSLGSSRTHQVAASSRRVSAPAYSCCLRCKARKERCDRASRRGPCEKCIAARTKCIGQKEDGYRTEAGEDDNDEDDDDDDDTN